MFGFGDKTTNALTMNEAHPDSLLDHGAQGVIGKPIDRIDGPLKVSGRRGRALQFRGVPRGHQHAAVLQHPIALRAG